MAMVPAADGRGGVFNGGTSVEYAFVECFGHLVLGSCAVRTVDHIGVKFRECRRLSKDGQLGRVELLNPAAIYREHPLNEAEAKRRAGDTWFIEDAEKIAMSQPPLIEVAKILSYCDDPQAPEDVRKAAEVVKRWHDQQMDDIPF